MDINILGGSDCSKKIFEHLSALDKRDRVKATKAILSLYCDFLFNIKYLFKIKNEQHFKFLISCYIGELKLRVNQKQFLSFLKDEIKKDIKYRLIFIIKEKISKVNFNG